MAKHHVPDDTSILDGNQGNDDLTLIPQPFYQTSLCAAAEYVGDECADRRNVGLVLGSYDHARVSLATRSEGS